MEGLRPFFSFFIALFSTHCDRMAWILLLFPKAEPQLGDYGCAIIKEFAKSTELG
jgi:hypothetical protein